MSTNTTRSEAYHTGYEAHEQGESRTANPYPTGSYDAGEWFAGYDAAGEPAAKRITIMVDGVWAGTGRLVGGFIEDCPACLGGSQDASDDIYEAIENAIADGDASEARDGDGLKINGHSYSWDIE